MIQNEDVGGEIPIKAWFELAKLAQEAQHNRRNYEWKLILGFWTAVGAGLYFIVEKEILLNDCWLISGAAVGLLVIFGSMVFWLYALHSADAGDREWRNYYLARTRRCSNAEDIKPQKNQKGDFEYKWSQGQIQWFWSRVFVTFFLLLAVFIAMTHRLTPPKDKDGIPLLDKTANQK
jgi:H+/Cl- antiporter ClcA